jgi:hypothetical protein
MGFQLWQVAAWQVATYLHKSSKNREKATRLRSALRWIEWVTDSPMHADARLVRDQVQDTRKGEKKRPKHAKPPSEDVIGNLEKLVEEGPTAQLRCAAGLFALLAHTSHRGLDGIRSRGMTVTETAFAGESLVKTSDVWTPWVIPLVGFSGIPWPQQWLQVLCTAGLPGPDYVLNGFDGCCKKWLPRPATVNDLETAFRVLLQTPPNTFSADEAAEMSVHGLRSYYITALTQMRARKSDRERVGRWRPGSAMPDHYDAIEGTAELMVRAKVTDAVKRGWRLSKPNEVPMKVPYKRLRTMGVMQSAPSAQAALQDVQPPAVEHWYAVNSKTGKLHVWGGSGEKTLCKRFVCGMPRSPSATTVFFRLCQRPDMEPCPMCEARA